MKVYRISKTQYKDDLNGTGSKLFGGRWNHIDTPCIYTSENRALAVLEYSVNIAMDFIPRALSISTFEIDENQIYELTLADLPGNWNLTPAPRSTRDFGTKLLQKKYGVLKIPSIVIPQEFNYILNPLAEKLSYKLLDNEDFIYDLRIKANT
ncbi:RES family NAD+ phosphorylase [Aequorivita echinoideorum]|uniref:RES domain-containing protein n=1 Tax=Aequorivita echinoideorum TaxID=1549647 RepID=A0ABS5S2T3_9FLAO|nr:RES family NAD+ phosphorylase [Aequorivita echinoideorum]MBT0606765.1 RES domain-containing protein [Aequorivita echinoideorum]